MQPQIQEEVEVRITQIEVTTWPRKDNYDSCLDLEKEDFELWVNGFPREILAVDRLGELGRLPTVPQPATAATTPLPSLDGPVETPSPARDPMQFVFYFDLWHLNKFTRECSAMSQPLAFSWVRKMLQEAYQPGDRVMLASFSGWPNIHTEWLEDRESALAALDEMETGPFMLLPNRGHIHHDKWVRGWDLILQALGDTPGRKHLFYMGDDLAWNPTPSQLYGLAGRAQANHVLVHAVDLIWNCRSRPPLLGSNWSMPLNLGTMPFHTGGRLFGGSQTVVRAVETLREMQGCRFLISFRSAPNDGRRRDPRVRVSMKAKGFRIASPVSYQDSRRDPNAEQRGQALLLLPRWEHGLRIDAAFWPLHPTGKRKRWQALLMARVRRPPGESGALGQMAISATVSHGARVYKDWNSALVGEALETVTHDPKGYILLFPVEVRSGEVSIGVTVHDPTKEFGGGARSTYMVPRPPHPGEARPWLLLDGFIGLPTGKTVIPAFQSAFPRTRPPLILGYACPPLKINGEIPPGRLLGLDGLGEQAVPLEWLGPGWGVEEATTSCGWVLGKPPATLSPGMWNFQPPASMQEEPKKKKKKKEDTVGDVFLPFRIGEEDTAASATSEGSL